MLEGLSSGAQCGSKPSASAAHPVSSTQGGTPSTCVPDPCLKLSEQYRVAQTSTHLWEPETASLELNIRGKGSSASLNNIGPREGIKCCRRKGKGSCLPAPTQLLTKRLAAGAASSPGNAGWAQPGFGDFSEGCLVFHSETFFF